MTGFNAETDLSIERQIAAPAEAIWRCWEEAALFRLWFAPDPVEILAVDNDLRGGGRAFCIMRLPDGSEVVNDGCFLLAEPCLRIVFTDAMRVGFRPVAQGFMTADIRLRPHDGGTLYSAHVMHAEAEARQKHEEMGFFEGWGASLDKLDALARTL